MSNDALRQLFGEVFRRWSERLPREDAAAARGDEGDVSRVSIPGILALLALGRGDGPANEERPPQPRDDATMRRILTDVAAQPGTPIKPEEAQEALGLLRSREFFGDLSSGLAAVVSLTRTAPGALLRDVLRLDRLPRALIDAIRGDLAEASEADIRSILTELRRGHVAPGHAPLDHTLRALMEVATLRTTVQTLRELIAPDNRTLRLAITVYVRAHGDPDFREEDLETVYRALDPDGPDLGPLIEAGLRRLHGQLGSAGAVKNALSTMGIGVGRGNG